jgi:Xaa-Pro aminopeptidase
LPSTVDALLVSRPPNLRYLTGFTGSNGALLLERSGSALLATDGRYVTQAAEQAPGLPCLTTRAVAAALVEHAAEHGLSRLGIEAGHVTLALHDALRVSAGGRLELIPAEAVVEQLRAVKDDAEIARLTRACAITDAGFAEVRDRLRPGVSEREVSWWLQQAMRDHGAEAVAFDSIVGFGPASAVPHHEADDRVLQAGDLVVLDFGARYDGYHADMTRTVVLGPVAGWQRDLHEAVLGIQQQRVAEAVVGAVPRSLDAAARREIEAANHDVAHGLGHGVGLEIHEDPFLTPGSAAGPLRAGSVITVEPGIYLPGRGGVRIEDTVVVTEAGTEPLTTSPRELVEVG